MRRDISVDYADIRRYTQMKKMNQKIICVNLRHLRIK